jgi:tetrahydromethanopterin S-methyltransferase subunit F
MAAAATANMQTVAAPVIEKIRPRANLIARASLLNREQ